MIFDFDRGFNDDHMVRPSRRATIAISANIIDELSTLHFAYSEALVDAGAVPIIIPANSDAEAIRSLMSGVDGLLLSGGDDIDGRYFNEENIPNLTSLNQQRDYYEFMLLRAAIDYGIPILGICRGAQVINVALGGTIYQDLPSMYGGDLLAHSILKDRHLPVHDIDIVEGSRLHKIMETTRLGVNSRHHQAIKIVAPELRATAFTGDGVVEAVESYPAHNIIALQCHPENMATTGGVPEMKRLFSWLVYEAELYHSAKQIHTLNPIVDSHCDTPMLYEQGGFDFSIRNSLSQVDLVKMSEGYLDATITVAYIPQTTAIDQATIQALSLLGRFRGDISSIGHGIKIARTAEDVLINKASGAKSVMLAIENGLAIGDDLQNIDLFKDERVVYITLCHNGTNTICDSAVGDAIHSGVSPFGAKVIERMNSLGITVDISHSSEQSTLDALRLSRQPIIASHSSCKALCSHPRNLSDATIKAIAEGGGVVQICAYGGFLKSEGGATILDIVEHIEHVVSLTGYNHVGVGSDFDGGGGVEGFSGSNNFIRLSVELLRRGHTPENIAKIMGTNILRVLSTNSNPQQL